MGIPIFHIVKENEFGLSGIANPDPGVGRDGFEHGSLYRPSVDLSTGDCAIINGEVVVPGSQSEPTYRAEFLQFDLSIVNVGEEWMVPNPDEHPEMFVTWPCNNAAGRKQLKDFVIVTFTDETGTVVKEHRRPGLFSPDVFLATTGIYKVGNRYPFGGQRIQVNDLKDGTYRIEIMVNPVYGESIPAVVWVKFTDQDLAIVPEPVEPGGFPTGLVWKKFTPA